MEQKEFQKMLTKAIENKTLVIGLDRSVKLLKSKKAALVAFASSAPVQESLLKLADEAGAAIYPFAGTNIELGELCKKPFRVAVIAIPQEGGKRE